jgi:hypothetical protein
VRKSKILLLFILIICAFVFSACWSAESNSSDGDDRTSTRTPTTRTPKDDDKSTPKDDDTPEDKNGDEPDNKMNDTPSNDVKSGGFNANLPSGFNQPTDPVGQKMLREYGAMFVAKGGVTPPSKVVFNNEAEVSAWQSSVSKSSENIGGTTIELQTPAMNALKKAIDEAKQGGLTITPRGGSDAGKRNYAGTVDNWNSRVEPNLKFYVGQGKITQSEADRIKALPIPQQIGEVFKLEDKGMWFSKDRSKSIIYSVAPPGTSQHISMLALDVNEYDNSKVRAILAKNGWFQTVKSDLPHFTYLGVSENELSKLGLKKFSDSGRTFWTP